MIRIALLLTLLAPTAALAASPFRNGDPKAGEALINKAKCNSCHASMYGGDGSEMYTRDNRKVKTPQELLARVRFCNTQAGANWFPDEEEHVAAYLNQKYYKFK